MTSEPDWDLTPYFSELGGADYRAFWRELRRDLDTLRERASGLGAIAEDREAWVAFLRDFEGVSERGQHLGSYLSCFTAANSADEAGQREEASLAALQASLQKLWIFVRSAFRAADDGAFRDLVETPVLEPVRYLLDRTRRRAEADMRPELEELNADLAVNGIDAWGRLYDRISGSLRFELERPGRPAESHPVSMARTFQEDADPEIRRAAMRGSGRAWESASDSVAACLNAIAGTRLTLYERRGIDHFLEPALFDAGIERETLDTMWATVRRRQEIPRRYLRKKAQLLSLPCLGFQDRMAPVGSLGKARIPWEDAKAQVAGAFGASYERLRAFAERAFARRWIDYRPREAKRPGGFCSSSSLLGESRIFMTYNGAPGDVQTLAHELGHGFHSSLMGDLRPWQRRYPMTLAETASTFAEKLVTDAALAAPNLSDETRLGLIDARLQDADAFLLDIPMRFDFECALYSARAEGELSVGELKELMLEAQRANYGDALDPQQLDPWFWASKLHFYITGLSFYNFPYTFGYLFSMGLYARAKAEGPSFLPRYEALLRATGSAGAERVAADALGVDLREEAFWDASIDLVEEDLEAYLAC